ncbi:MAG TPA: hypothetical protein PKY78_03170 [Candidatus Omnitrophota bacterium]|nr:hypothetical protein [Candidatus Omnitrophota bacterium]HPS19975.1 hypothetical protein [Candidatus Omnitrophota bacterium]
MIKKTVKEENKRFLEMILKFQSSSVAARLDWLEEANRLTYSVLTKSERSVRKKLLSRDQIVRSETSLK